MYQRLRQTTKLKNMLKTLEYRSSVCLVDVCCALGLQTYYVKERLDDDLVSNHPISDAFGKRGHFPNHRAGRIILINKEYFNGIPFFLLYI